MLITTKEFCELIQIAPKHLPTYFNPPRSKFIYTIVDGKRMIDTDEKINALFIKERQEKIKKNIPNEPAPKQVNAEIKKEESKKNADIFAIKEDLEVKKLEKITQEVFILELKKSKMAGEMVPFVLVQPITFQCLQYIHTQQKISDESFLNEVSHKYVISTEDMAYYRSFFIKGRNAAITSASNELIVNLDNIMDTYKTKRDAGERN